MTGIKTIDQYAARLLMVSFFLPANWQVYTIMGVSTWFIIRALATKTLVRKTDYLWALLFSCLFLIYFLSIPFTPVEYREYLLHICEHKVSLFFAPFVMALVGLVFRKAIIGELQYFVYGCFLSCLAGNLDYIYHYYFIPIGLHGLSHVDYRIIFEKCTGIHPTYMGMFISFSICIIFLSDVYNYRNGHKIKYSLVFILFLFLLALLAKSALIALVLILFHYGWRGRNLIYRNKLPLAVFTITLLAATYLIPFTGQRLREVFSFFGHGARSSAADNSVYARKMILDEDLALLKSNWLTGAGPERVSLNQNINVSHFDPHNEYLDEWLGFGIAGIALLVALLAVHFWRAVKSGNNLYLYCLVILTISFFTETVLARQQGVLFYALFTSLFFFSSAAKVVRHK